jgi:DnaJ domain
VDHVDAHATLRVSPEATPEEVRAAYRRRAFETHPDRAKGSTSEFQAVAEAYRVLSDPSRDPGGAQGPDASSRVPGMDAAKVLFEYLSDLASEMILNGAAPDAIVSFLAQEGCPESVARALEQDLRRRVKSAASEGSRRSPDPSRADQAPPGGEGKEPSAPPEPRPGGLPSFARWAALALVVPGVMACALMAWRIAGRVGASEPHAQGAPPQAVVAAPQSAPPHAAPVPSTAPHPRPLHAKAPRPSAREHGTPSLSTTSAQLDAERAQLEADRGRLSTEAAELQLERQRLDAAEAALGTGGDPAQIAALRRQSAAYDARLAAARRTEQELQRRTQDLNSRIVAYNNRVRSSRQR